MDTSDVFVWSTIELEHKLRSGLSPDTVVITFFQVRLIHVWARQGSIEHLKILHKYGADFSFHQRQGTTVRTELETNLKKTKEERYMQCLDWLDENRL